MGGEARGSERRIRVSERVEISIYDDGRLGRGGGKSIQMELENDMDLITI